jgi:formyltetrahydrofolate synthetase
MKISAQMHHSKTYNIAEVNIDDKRIFDNRIVDFNDFEGRLYFDADLDNEDDILRVFLIVTRR